MDGLESQCVSVGLITDNKMTESLDVSESAEPDYLNSDEEEELNSFASEFTKLLKAETIKSRKKRPKDSIAKDSIQVYSLTVAILSEELLSQLPGVINFTLRNFSSSNKVCYRKVGNYRIFLGSTDQLKRAESKLLELTEQNKVNVKVEKETTTSQTIQSREIKRPGRRKRVITEDTFLNQPVVDCTPSTPEGRRMSSRLCGKPRKSYASLHTVGQTDDAVQVKVELELDGNLDLDPDYIPNKCSKTSDQEKTDEDTVIISGEAKGDSIKENPPNNDSLPVSDLADKDKLQPPKRRGPGRPPKRAEKNEMCNCEICFLKFPSKRLLQHHHNKHFNVEGLLTETALALHVQGLIKYNMEENLMVKLAEQVKAYRDTLKSGSTVTPNGDGTQDSFIINEIRVEGVEDSAQTLTVMTDVVRPATSEHSDTTILNSCPTPVDYPVRDTPKKKRGRKSNFEKGMPFMIRGRVVSGHLGGESDQKMTSEESKTDQDCFECEICHNKMVSLQSLKVHMQNVHINRNRVRGRCRRIHQEELKCPHCSFICYRTQNFTRHLKTHNNPDLYMCDKCDYTHKLRAEVLRHKRNAHAEKNFRCEHCGSLHRNQSLLNMHIKLKHTLAYSMVCDTCGKRCNTKSAYREHIAKHESGELDGPPGQIMCTLCARVLPSRNSFEQHKLKFHGEDFEAEETRKMNEGVVIFNSGTFQCKYCQNYTNSIAREVRRHILRKHMPRKYQCDQCKAAFPLEKLLIKHVRIVHYGLEKKKCTECNKWFRNNTYLTQHVKRVHSAEFQCNICKKLLSDKRTLQDHYEIHKAPQDRAYKFICEICQKKYRFQSNYDYHMTEHTGSKPFVCSVCSRQFRTKHVLDRHMATHSEDRPFACDKCPKSFKLKKYLDAHLLTHSGNRYVCNLCWKPFVSKDALSKHTCKSYVVQADGSTPVDLSHVQIAEMAANDDRIVQGQILIEGTPGEEMVQYYVCAACREGFIDADEAIGHVCQTEDAPAATSALSTDPATDLCQLEGGSSQPEENSLRVDGTQFAVIADGTSSTTLSSILAEPQAGMLDSESLLGGTGTLVDESSLLPNQQFVLMEQERAVMAADVPEDERTAGEGLPVEMYMCGLCNVLFNSQNDIQDHLQIHAEELAQNTTDQILLPDNMELDKQQVPIVQSIDEPVVMDVVPDDPGSAIAMVLEDGTEHDILLKDEEPELVHME